MPTCLLYGDVVRRPASEVIEPWVVAMLRRAAPFPAPRLLPGGTARFVETFFVDSSGLFQALSLSEGQKGSLPADSRPPPAPAPQ